MFTFIKRSRTLIALGLLSLLILSSCDTAAPILPENNCVWREDSLPIQFLDAILQKPLYWCDESVDEQFYTPEPEYYTSILELCDDVHQDLGEELAFSWISSVYSKQCDTQSPSSISKVLSLDNNNYSQVLLQGDFIEQTPIVRGGNGIDDQDYKHQLIIQVKGVENPYSPGLIGTVTWTKTWLGTTNAPHDSAIWQFDCQGYSIKATFTPDRGNPRYIYRHDHFEFM